MLRLQDMGLAFDEWDLDYYYNLFVEDMKRNPTNVELFDIAQVGDLHKLRFCKVHPFTQLGLALPKCMIHLEIPLARRNFADACSPTVSTLATGFSVETWSLTGRRCQTRCSTW